MKYKQSPDYRLQKKFVGYGHYQLEVIGSNGDIKTVVTDCLDLIERLNSEFDSERKEAEKEAINLVLNS